MKLSYRDKVIFICVIVIVVLLAGFFVFIKPAADNSNVAKQVLEQKQSEQADVQSKIDTLPTLIDTLVATANDIDELQKNFCDDQLPYQNEQYIYEMLDSCGVEVKSVNTSYTTASDAVEYMVYPQNVLAYELQINSDLYNELPQEVYDSYNDVGNASGSSIVIGITEVTIGYTDSYDIAKEFKFLDKISDDPATTNILGISTGEKPTDNQEITGEITMRIYSINKMNTENLKKETQETALEEAKAASAVTEEAAAE